MASSQATHEELVFEAVCYRRYVGADAASIRSYVGIREGKDIWLFGGGSLFRSLLEARLVDTVEVAVMPVLLGSGLPLLPPPAGRAKLKLASSKALKSGIISLEYAFDFGAAE